MCHKHVLDGRVCAARGMDVSRRFACVGVAMEGGGGGVGESGGPCFLVPVVALEDDGGASHRESSREVSAGRVSEQHSVMQSR